MQVMSVHTDHKMNKSSKFYRKGSDNSYPTIIRMRNSMRKNGSGEKFCRAYEHTFETPIARYGWTCGKEKPRVLIYLYGVIDWWDLIWKALVLIIELSNIHTGLSAVSFGPGQPVKVNPVRIGPDPVRVTTFWSINPDRIRTKSGISLGKLSQIFLLRNHDPLWKLTNLWVLHGLSSVSRVTVHRIQKQ